MASALTKTAGGDEWSADFYGGLLCWTIDNFTDMSACEDGKKRYSAEFTLGTFKWRLLVFPRGNRDPLPATHTRKISAFLTSADEDVHCALRTPSAVFAIHIHNQLVPDRKLIKETEHTFTADEDDWGSHGSCHSRRLSTRPMAGA
ncbi:hypothetical protein FOA52_011971 [Chlamydomonas sp. UWO 241]|nr:hypothetical protein FOA52_011971 [Chlamydomonas sp. UWO 241]